MRMNKSFGTAVFAGLFAMMTSICGGQEAPAKAKSDIPVITTDVIDVGDRLEPFIDTFLVDKMEGVTHRLHHPIQVRNLPQPPSAGYYATVIYEKQKYRHYCRETMPGYSGSDEDGNPGEVTAYEESTDGVNWTRPNLGLFEVNGSKSNNYILVNMSPFSHNFSPFLDARPGCPPEERFKALAGTSKSGGLVAFISADGIRWKKLREEPVLKTIAGGLMFDSQNVACWSSADKCYVAFCRQHIKGLRSINRATSPDFINWSALEQVPANLPDEHLYTSQAHPYFRAPHITIGLASRFFPKRGSSTDIVLLTTRDGKSFNRTFKEAFIRPAPTKDSWGNRGNYAALNVFPLRDDRPNIQAEHWRYLNPQHMGFMVRDRLYYLPLDGFASIHAGYEPGHMTTKAFKFSGKELMVNFETSAAGSIRVTIQDQVGQVIPGFGADDMKEELRGNERTRIAVWKQGSSLQSLVGRIVRLHFELKEADLYSICFVNR